MNIKHIGPDKIRPIADNLLSIIQSAQYGPSRSLAEMEELVEVWQSLHTLIPPQEE